MYWIHLPSHTNMWEEGYIGITVQGVTTRFYEHKKEVNKPHSTTVVSNAIRKYGDTLVVDEILVGSKSYCLWLEQHLRPTAKIGWNIVPGGGAPPVFTKGHTEEAKLKIGEAAKLIKFNQNFIASVERKRG